LALASPLTNSKNEGGSSGPLVPKGLGLAFFLVTVLFFLWGIPNNLNDVLIRQFMTSFAVTRLQAGLVQSAFYFGYFVFATPAALLMRRSSYKTGFVIGLILFSTGAFLFYPAAVIDRYGLFLGALFVIASGLSFLETASNPFIAQLGPPESAARRLNVAQAFNPLGSITGVLIGTIFIFSGVELTPAQVAAMKTANTYTPYLRHETMRVVAPYLILGTVTLLWAVLIIRTKFPAIAREGEGAGQSHGSYRELLRYPHFLFAVVAQFAYIGAQVGTWSYFIQYVQETAHQPEKIAGYFLTGTLVIFAIGRFVSAGLMRHFDPRALMGMYTLCNIGLVAVGVLFPGWVGLWAIFLTSFFMSVMFPTIFALGIDGLDRNTKIGGSLIVMAIVGGAVLTPFMGWIAERSISIAYLLPLVCYCVVAFYCFVGARMKPRMA
jgi:FHS family L-fucose permease-like MFS transporter